MNLPLYTQARQAFSRSQNGHRGLWFERFFDRYSDQWEIPKENTKTEWLQDFQGQCGNAHQLQRHIRQTVDRLAYLAEGDFRSFCRPFVTDWHFVTGLGLPHPVENGFFWHPTL